MRFSMAKRYFRWTKGDGGERIGACHHCAPQNEFSFEWRRLSTCTSGGYELWLKPPFHLLKKKKPFSLRQMRQPFLFCSSVTVWCVRGGKNLIKSTKFRFKTLFEDSVLFFSWQKIERGNDIIDCNRTHSCIGCQ